MQNAPAVQCSDNVSVNMSSNVHTPITVDSALHIPTNTNATISNGFTGISTDAPVDNVVDLSLTPQALTSSEYKKLSSHTYCHVHGRGCWILRKWLKIKS